MSLQYTPEDFVLEVEDHSERTTSIVGKYEAFLNAITTEDFDHVREAIRESIKYFVSEKYSSTKELAKEKWGNSSKLHLKYNSFDNYLRKIELIDKKSASIDLATGTGKSWVIYGVAAIALAEGFVDKVLVLCPSLTIEEGLKNKFEQLAGSQVNQKILQELGAIHSAPSIKNANVPITSGDICVENIHAVYKRTGSSIEDSFKGKGQRTLVISDEAHHIYSPDDTATKKWLSFLKSKEYDFSYHLGLTGTPYVDNEYFHDIIYRYGIKQAIEDKVVKSIDYKLEEADEEKGWDETWKNHTDFQKKYVGKLKPISIVVTDRIYRTVELWQELCKYISEKESISFDEASKKVIWVASGLPSNKNEKEVVESILEEPEKVRKENLSLLKTVDEPDNPVEWIISVGMLTEGWDVQNVFQIVPHEKKAFNSKLLISQVLGRGLRIPEGLEQPSVRINNHESWSDEIKNLYQEVLEIDSRITYGYYEKNEQYGFPLYNLDYSHDKEIVSSGKQPSSDEPKVQRLKPQNKVKRTQSTYSESGTISFQMEIHDNQPIDIAVRQIKLFLKEKDPKISKEWPTPKIKQFIQNNLDSLDYDSSYVSQENLATFKQAFGPMFRDQNKEVVRLILKVDNIEELEMSDLPNQSFSENSLKRDGYLFYSKERLDQISPEDYVKLEGYVNDKENYSAVRDSVIKYGGSEEEIKFLKENLFEVKDAKLKTVHDLVYVSHEPEKKFTKTLIANIDLFDSFLKAPDRGFYNFPYSYKPAGTGYSHVKSENFNPDFILKLKGEKTVLVVEIKSTDDNNYRNKAKLRDGKRHFSTLNKKLESANINWKYHFYFLSPENFTDFFQAIRDNRLDFKSELMQILDEGNKPF